MFVICMHPRRNASAEYGCRILAAATQNSSGKCVSVAVYVIQFAQTLGQLLFIYRSRPPCGVGDSPIYTSLLFSLDANYAKSPRHGQFLIPRSRSNVFSADRSDEREDPSLSRLSSHVWQTAAILRHCQDDGFRTGNELSSSTETTAGKCKPSRKTSGWRPPFAIGTSDVICVFLFHDLVISPPNRRCKKISVSIRSRNLPYENFRRLAEARTASNLLCY